MKSGRGLCVRVRIFTLLNGAGLLESGAHEVNCITRNTIPPTMIPIPIEIAIMTSVIRQAVLKLVDSLDEIRPE